MWFNNAIGKEKIKFMFNNDLLLIGVEFDKFVYYDMSRLTVCFNTKKVPSSVPEKWKDKPFNSLSISLTFTEVIELKVNGAGVGFECDPMITSVNGITNLVVKNEGFNLLCTAKYMFIDDVVPYLDARRIG
nr:Imm50 family immunity protein [Erwinia sp. Ejp617]